MKNKKNCFHLKNTIIWEKKKKNFTFIFIFNIRINVFSNSKSFQIFLYLFFLKISRWTIIKICFSVFFTLAAFNSSVVIKRRLQCVSDKLWRVLFNVTRVFRLLNFLVNVNVLRNIMINDLKIFEKLCCFANNFFSNSLKYINWQSLKYILTKKYKTN